MACLKCGKKTRNEQGFCPRCLEVMAEYPVKSDVPIQLPNRSASADSKKPARKRRVLSPEEQLPILRRKVHRLTLLVVALILLLVAAGFLLVKDYFDGEELPVGQNFGQNYSSDQSAD